MKATQKVNLELGGQDIEVSIYSAVDEETSFKQISKCCGTKVNYKKTCAGCSKELLAEEISKAIEVAKDEFKIVDADKVKVENSDLKVLGVLDDNVENGVTYNGTTWFVGVQVDKKKTDRTLKNFAKYSYLREALKASNKTLAGVIRSRGKEKLVSIKPYQNGLIAQGLNYHENLRDIKEVEGYDFSVKLDTAQIKAMADTLSQKAAVDFKAISNDREKIIEEMVIAQEVESTTQATKKDEVEINTQALVSF
jgi:DNA end-binding protein Ku